MLDAAAQVQPVRLGIIGVGKMGLSHLSIARAIPGVEVTGVCDSADYLLDVLHKYSGVPTFKNAERMLDEAKLDALIVATPTGSHFELVNSALERNIHVFCEKPLTLNSEQSIALAKTASDHGLVAQVGYHNRFVATFQEVRRLLADGVLGRPSHVLAEAYGPVVLKPTGSTWRSRRSSGGGCLYDYAAHPINLLNWYLGSPRRVRGSVINSIFSKDTDDEVYATLDFDDGLSAQLSVNWSDESYRKMSTSITVSGSMGRIVADRQELRVYLRDGARIPDGYRSGWNIRYITELTPPVQFYLRGEEYSAQLEHFVAAVQAGEGAARDNSFSSAAETDSVIELIQADARRGEDAPHAEPPTSAARPPQRRWWHRFRRHR